MTSAFNELTYTIGKNPLRLRLESQPLQKHFGQLQQVLRALASMTDAVQTKHQHIGWMMAGVFKPILTDEAAAYAVIGKLGNSLLHDPDGPDFCTAQRIMTRQDFLWLAGWKSISPFGKQRLPVRFANMKMLPALFMEPETGETRLWHVRADMSEKNAAQAYG